ncbi:unnamed protein product [Closterium sp. Yama58-4]|nr:unnamed protein product [Closterium sp. Yama58-4]
MLLFPTRPAVPSCCAAAFAAAHAIRGPSASRDVDQPSAQTHVAYRTEPNQAPRRRVLLPRESPEALRSGMQLHGDAEGLKPRSSVNKATAVGTATAVQASRRRVLLPRESPEVFGSGMQLHEDLLPLWDMAARVAVNGTVLVVVSNAGYTDMLENWVRHVSNAGLGAHFILFAEDEETLRFGQTRWPGQTIHLALPDQSLSATWQASSEALFPHSPHSATRAGTLSFHLLASRRILYLLHLLSFGFNLLYSDTDVAILRNPLPEITADPKQTFDIALTLDGYESNWQKKAVQVESYGVSKLADRKLSVSSSLLFLRPTSGAKCLVGDWANRVMKLGRDEGTEQEHLNAIIVEMDKYGLLPRIAVLPAQKFLSGQLLLEDDWATVEALKGELVTVHAGGLMGKDAKRYALNKLGFWIAESDAAAAAGEGESGGKEATAVGERGEAAAAGGGGRASEGEAGAGSISEPASTSSEDSKWPSTTETSALSSSSSSSVGSGDKGPFCVGLLCPEMHVSEEEVVLLSVESWVQRHVQQMDPLVPMLASADRFVIVTAACKGQIPLFTNWFNAMHSAAMAGHVIASVPQEVEGTSQGLLRQPEESESPYKAALTCLLLPSLLMERVLKLSYNVIYSDISSVWLQDPLPFLPPEYNAVLPSSAPSSSQSSPPSNNKIDGKLKRTLPISRPDLGYFSPWFVALRPSRPILLMLKEWAVLALEDFRERTAAAHRNSLAHSLSASESLKVGLNEAVTRMVEEGEPGSNVGVLSRWLFPPVWKVMGEREWFAKHREEVAAVPNDCGDDVSHREMCFRDLKLWV